MLVAAYLRAKSRAVLCTPAHRARAPQNSANSEKPSAAWTATGSSGPVAKPSRKPHRTSHGIVPAASSTAGDASRRNDVARRSGPGGSATSPIRSPATPPTTMHEISSGPCEEIRRRKAMPLPAPIASPAIVPSSSPLKNSA